MAYCTVADVKAQARLGPADTLDDARAQQCVEAAARLIDEHFGWPADPPVVPDGAQTALLRLANTQVALELLKRPAFGIFGAYDEAGAIRVSADVMLGVRTILLGVGSPAWGLS